MKKFELKQKITEPSKWLEYDNESTCLLHAIDNSVDTMTSQALYRNVMIYVEPFYTSTFYLFMSFLNGISEAIWSNAGDVYIFCDTKYKCNQDLDFIFRILLKLFNKDICLHICTCDEYINSDQYVEYKNMAMNFGHKYRKICDLQHESHVYSLAKVIKAEKIFYINQLKPGKLLKNCGVPIVTPFFTKQVDGFMDCPSYAKSPPAGYCARGAARLMVKHEGGYKCFCNRKDEVKNIELAWTECKSKIEELVEIRGKKHSQFDKNFKIDARYIDHSRKKIIILFGSLTWSLSNILLISIAKYMSPKSKNVTVIVDDLLPSHIYSQEMSNSFNHNYQILDISGIDLIRLSEFEGSQELILKWLQNLQIKDIRKIRKGDKNNSCYPYHVYDALHLAVMGTAFEIGGEGDFVIHSYNESAIHLFKRKINCNTGFISCHGLQGYQIRFKQSVRKEMTNLICSGKLYDIEQKKLTVLKHGRVESIEVVKLFDQIIE